MSEINNRSIRILFDLQACQTEGSAKRGVGRYSESLFKAIIHQSRPRQIHGLLSKQHKFFPQLSGVQPDQLIYGDVLPEIESPRFYAGGELDSIDNIFITHNINSVAPDVIHVSHVFEGFNNRVPIPLTPSSSGGHVLSATLYDLIPLRFPEIYFKSNSFKRWYYSKLDFYYQADLLLAISESSRKDAIEFLGINPEKIVTIMGGVDKYYKPPEKHDETKTRLTKKYNLKRPGVVLYTGGDDHRKNLLGALKAYSLLPSTLRHKNQLVIICSLESHRREFFLNEAIKLGLLKEEVCFLGFISEDDLISFYGICDVFFFPSLYEGLGLPVIEAMSCGAPTLCGNNSSLKELVARQDATFDSSSSESIALGLKTVLENKTFASDLKQYGLERAKNFTWKNTANKAIEAFDEALAKKRNALTLAAANNILPKPRMAMLTPLPPTKSGIADYNSVFLPYLSRHFNIDIYTQEKRCSDLNIQSCFRVFDVANFGENATSYDVIFYEIGNSEYHSHMLALMNKYPGVVGLHDAFLSGLMGYLEFNLGYSHKFAQEMLYSHGSIARRIFAPVQENPDANNTAMIDLPCTKSVLENALGIISHSEFNLELAREFFPKGWLAPYRIIPQMVKIKEKNNKESNRQAKKALGFNNDDFIITTFGHIAWTKWGDRILQAFLNSSLSEDPTCHLVFAGELSKDDFGTKLKNAVKNSKVQARITITGYLLNEDYDSYLKATNFAIQLRTNSRGGMPKGVLDCLSVGLPVVVNNAASYMYYPADVVLKLSPEPSLAEITDTFELLRKDHHKCQSFSDKGFQYIKQKHNPENIAAQYAGAIHEFVNRYKSRMLDTFVGNITPHLAGIENSLNLIPAIAQTFQHSHEQTFPQNRLIIDCSYISEKDDATGIPRTVKEIVREAYCSNLKAFETIAVKRVRDKLVLATDWLEQQRLLLSFETKKNNRKPVEFKLGDYLLMLDSSWDDFDKFEPVFNAARKARVPIITAVYDLLPIILSPSNFVKDGPKWFEICLHKIIAESDGLICISKTVAKDLIRFIDKNNLSRPGLKIGWWHLGCNPKKPVKSEISERIYLATTLPYCVMVGTIEPRKNHALAIDAFEKLWEQGCSLNLIIAGKPGWLVDDLIAKIKSHDQLGKHLFYIEEPSDYEISFLYQKAQMLLFASKGEGFGLPIIEASYFGTPILCSNIPSFKEIVGDNAFYTNISSVESLSAEIEHFWKLIKAGKNPNSKNIAKLSWKESTSNLLNIILKNNWYKIY